MYIISYELIIFYSYYVSTADKILFTNIDFPANSKNN